jgi:hippurate hydrolase
MRCGIALIVLATSLHAATPGDWARQNIGELTELYRHLHANPELSLMEEKTAARIAAELRAAGLEVTEKVGGHGVVGVLKNGAGPRLLIRTDLDALPVTEQTPVAYTSKVRVKTAEGVDTGVMHACGHDVHMTCFVGVARWMSGNKDRWGGTILFVGQPAEERVMGARAMLKDGLYERFGKPDFALALHVDSSLETGKVGHRAGYAMANSDSVDVTVFGRGGHGAHPELTIDPIVQAAHLVLELQTIVSREVSALEPAVITVGSIHAGTKHNIISDRAELQLTVRSYTEATRKLLFEAISRRAKGVAIAAGAPEPKIEIREGVPAVYNTDDLAARVVKVFQRVLGEANVVEARQTMGAEDFGLFKQGGVPIFMYRLGSVSAQRLAATQPPVALHSPFYYPDAEPAIVTGVSTMCEAAMDLLKR